MTRFAVPLLALIAVTGCVSTTVDSDANGLHVRRIAVFTNQNIAAKGKGLDVVETTAVDPLTQSLIDAFRAGRESK